MTDEEIFFEKTAEISVGEMKNKEGRKVVMAGCGTRLEAIGYCRIAVDGTVSTGLYQWPFEENTVDFFGLTNEMTAVMAARCAWWRPMANRYWTRSNGAAVPCLLRMAVFCRSQA